MARRAGDGAGRAPVLVAEPLLAKAVGEDAEVLERIPGRELEGLAYERPFDLCPPRTSARAPTASYSPTT